MRCVYSLLRAPAVAVFFLPLMAWAQAALEVSLDHEKKQLEPFKPKQDISFKVKNNTPIQHELTITVDGVEASVTGCTSVLKDDSCSFTVTPDEFGLLKVIVKTLTGRYIGASDQYSVAYRIASFNLSFDRTCTSECSKDGSVNVQCKDECDNGFDILQEQMALSKEKQQELIDKLRNDAEMSDSDKTLAKAAIQIRNVAEIIQRKNPDAFVLAEFDNNGTALDSEGVIANQALKDFQDNYLSVAQQSGLSGLVYKSVLNVPTNTGELSGEDLNHDERKDGPDDAWGHGYFHGQYAFAVMAKEDDSFGNHRSFRKFKWSDMPEAENPSCENPGEKDHCPWYANDVWLKMRLSSKNHLDLPVKIPDLSGTMHNVHFLVSHPTPPVFDFAARHNFKRNRAEVQFWIDYIEQKDYFKTFSDDDGNKETLEDNAYFIIAGDLNVDPDYGDGHGETIRTLLNHSKVKTEATVGTYKPESRGAPEFLRTDCNKDRYAACRRDKDQGTVTSTFALRADYVIPSNNFVVLKSGVFWPASGEDGRYLVKDPKFGWFAKDVSSDHRMVWVDLYIPSKSTTSKTEL